MKPAARVPAIVIVFFLFTLFLPFKNVDQDGRGQLLRQDVAWAQNYLTAEEEPFAEESVVTADPLEPFNRAIFKFNDKLYFWVLKPVGQAYGTVVPEGIRIGIRNAYDNILFPVRVVNNSLQGKFKRAGVEMGRFVINSTLGFGGMFDLAARDFDLQPYDEDFGQTLGFYGMKPIVYVTWPFLGPSTLRDTAGLAGDYFLNPIFYLSPNVGTSAGVRGGTILNDTSLRIGEYEDFKDSALDPYVSMRDAYLNYRANQIKK